MRCPRCRTRMRCRWATTRWRSFFECEGCATCWTWLHGRLQRGRRLRPEVAARLVKMGHRVGAWMRRPVPKRRRVL